MVLKHYSRDWLHGPFGTPDASRSDALDKYIPVIGSAPDISQLRRKLQERVIIGKKGAGKTIYLRTLMDLLPRTIDREYSAPFGSPSASGENWYVFRELFALSTDQVVAVSNAARRYHSAILRSSALFVDPKARAKDLWTKCWENAIIATLFKLYFSKHADAKFKAIADGLLVRQEMRNHWSAAQELIGELPDHPSPIIMLKAFINNGGPKLTRMRALLDDHRWDLAHLVVSALAANSPPIALFIDAIDEDFDRAPEAWLDCQEGLFRTIFRFLNRSDAFSNRVHIIVALREIAYSSLLRSEHASRFLTDPHVRYITWDIRAAKNFFHEKVKSLQSTPFAEPQVDGQSYPVLRWLGFERIKSNRNADELVVDYIIRHTRLLPRDLVIMGNALCQEQQLRHQEGKLLTQRKLRQIVSDVAKSIATEAIESSIQEHLASMDYVAELLLLSQAEEREAILADIDSLIEVDGDGARAAERRINARIATTIRDIKSSVLQRIDNFFRLLGKEKFSHAELLFALKEARLIDDDELSGRSRPLFYRFDNILWRHGLLAYQAFDGGEYRWRFSWRAPPTDQMTLPEGHDLYGVHSSVLDLYRAVKVDGNDPVF